MADSNTEAVAKSYVERFTHLFEEIGALQADVSDISEEAKDAGFDVSALKKVAKLRMKDTEKVEAQRTHLFNIVAYAKAVQLDLDFGMVGVVQAAQKLRETVRKSGGSATIEAEGMEPVTIS